MKGLIAFAIAGPVLLLGSAASAQKVEVCHVPPGNPSNAHTISVAERAVRAHLAHGDTTGACECRTDGDCADGNLCDADRCVRGKCAHETTVECPVRPCVASASCVPETGQCVEVPIDCGNGVCDPSTGECGPCDFRLSVNVPDPSTACPGSSGCEQCCLEAPQPPDFLSSCSQIILLIDDFPNHCFCLGCNCLQ